MPLSHVVKVSGHACGVGCADTLSERSCGLLQHTNVKMSSEAEANMLKVMSCPPSWLANAPQTNLTKQHNVSLGFLELRNVTLLSVQPQAECTKALGISWRN